MASPLGSRSLSLMRIAASCVVSLFTTALPVRAGDGGMRTTAEVLKAFRDPPAAYRAAPLWVWNDRMSTALVDRDLADLKAKGFGGVFIHPRPGLITPYMSDEWLALVRHTVDAGKNLGMKVWIYDENSYPSGFAGGIVPALMPDAKRAAIRMMRADSIIVPFTDQPFLILAPDGTGYADVTARALAGGMPRGDYRIFHVVEEQPAPWHGGYTYVDMMRPDVTRTFIEVTLKAYEQVIGDAFGTVVPGVFQDEAEVRPARIDDHPVVQYTPALFDRFRERFGYDLRPVLPSLYEAVGDWRRVRHDFYALVLTLFIDGWAKQYYDSCSAHNLALTGHYWEHDWPRPALGPDNMAMYQYAHVPGVDVLMNEFRTDVHAQFGNVRAVKEIRSVANQLGRERTLSETFGAGGWEMTFADQKRIADWEYALGVNLMNQHLTYVTLAGARKRDHPLSFSYHEPWWKFYRPLNDHFGRLSVALSAGEQVNEVLVLEPTTTGWMHYGAVWPNPVLDSLGTAFQDLVNAIEDAQIEYDLGSEDILRNHGSVAGKRLVVGKRSYGLVVLPPMMENIESTTLTLLRRYVEAGGMVLYCGEPPAWVDGRPGDAVRTLFAANAASCKRTDAGGAVAAITRLAPPVLTFRDASGVTAPMPLLFHHRRTFPDGELLFLANTRTTECRGSVVVPAGSCEMWDLATGTALPYPFVKEGSGIAIDFAIPSGGSVLFRTSPEPAESPMRPTLRWTEIRPDRESVIRRVAPNVLTLDFCDLTMGGTTTKDLYFYEAQQRTWVHHGFDRNPWDNAVQYRSAILDRDTFAVNTGFEAGFRFMVEQGVETRSLRAVVERPGVFRVAINGTPVKPVKDAWWLDQAFGVYDIGPHVRPGENTVTVIAAPFTIHTELEPVYIIGDFALENARRGFTMVPAGPVQRGAWNEQGMPFYGDGVGYTQEFGVPAGKKGAARYEVQLGRWRGVVAHVAVNGKDAGTIMAPPYALDVTRLVKAGKNSVTVTVYGSLKNTLGPHHGNPPPGMAWPGSFQRSSDQKPAVGSAYHTFAYGLFEEFLLRKGSQ